MKYHPNIDNRSLSEFSMLCKEDGFYGDFENSRENWPTCLQDVECEIPPEIPTSSEYVLKKVCNYYWFVQTECTVWAVYISIALIQWTFSFLVWTSFLNRMMVGCTSNTMTILCHYHISWRTLLQNIPIQPSTEITMQN